MTYSWRWAFPGVGRQGWWPVHGTLFRHRRESLNLWLGLWFLQYYFNVVKTIINHPFANGLYHLFMVIWGWFILVLTTLFFMIFAQHIYNIWWWFTIFRIIYHIYHIWEWITGLVYIPFWRFVSHHIKQVSGDEQSPIFGWCETLDQPPPTPRVPDASQIPRNEAEKRLWTQAFGKLFPPVFEVIDGDLVVISWWF